MEEVDEYFPYGPSSIGAYTSMYWVDSYLIDMESHWDMGLTYTSSVLDIVAHSRTWEFHLIQLDGTHEIDVSHGTSV